MTITQNFEVQIVALSGPNSAESILPALAKAITGFERDFEDEEDVDDDQDQGFLLADTSDDEDGEGDPQDHAEDEEHEEEEVATGVLTVQVQVTREALEDLNVLREMEECRIGITFSYGGGLLNRTFEVSNDLWITMNGGSKNDEPLTIEVNFETFDASTDF